MSIRVMAQVWDMQLSCSQKLVLLALADCADDHGRNVYPSIACVMQKTSMPKRTVQRIRAQIIAAGILVPDGCCPANPQIPRFRIATRANLAPGGVSSGMGGVSPVAWGGCHGGTGGVSPMAPVSVRDPSVDPSEDPEHVLARFEAFWNAYPRKTGKHAAEKAWKSLKPTVTVLDAILAALAWQSRLPQWVESARFIPHPATYLNGRRWEDERPKDEGRFGSALAQSQAALDAIARRKP